MNRKSFIERSLGTLAATSLLSTLQAQEHKHGSNSTAKHAKAMMSAIHCKMAAEICLSHCLDEMGKGDKSMAPCAKSTREVIAACDAFLSFASAESGFTKKLSVVCAEICESCAKECKKHADHHKVCKDCMDSCLACAKEMKAF